MTNEQAIEVLNGHIKDSSIAYGTFTGQALRMAIEALKVTDIEHLPPAQPVLTCKGCKYDYYECVQCRNCLRKERDLYEPE